MKKYSIQTMAPFSGDNEQNVNAIGRCQSEAESIHRAANAWLERLQQLAAEKKVLKQRFEKLFANHVDEEPLLVTGPLGPSRRGRSGRVKQPILAELIRAG